MYKIKNKDVISTDLLSIEEAKILPIGVLSIVKWSWLHMIIGKTLEESELIAHYIGNDKVLLCEYLQQSIQ